MTFTDENIRPNARRRKLVTITLSDPADSRDDNYNTDPGAAPVLRLCELGEAPYGVVTVSGVDYHPLVADIDGTVAASSFGISGPDGFGTIILENGRYPWQMKHSGGQVRATGTNIAESYQNDVKLSQIFSDYIVMGANIAIYAAVQSPGGTWSTSQRFAGLINNLAYDEQTISIGYIEDKSGIKQIPSEESPGGGTVTGGIVTKVGYPNAPDSSIGSSIPMIFSAETSLRAPESYLGLAVNPQLMTAIWPGVITDAKNDGSSSGKVFFNKHDGTMGNSAFGSQGYIWIPEMGTLAYLASGVSTNSASEDYMNINLNPIADIYLNPVQVQTGSGGTDEGKMFDGRSDTYGLVEDTYQSLLVVPNVYPLGKMKEIRVFAVLAAGTGVDTGPGASSPNLRMSLWNNTAGAVDTGFTAYDITKAGVEAGGYFESVVMPTANMDTAYIRDWRWERDAAGVSQPLLWSAVGLSAGVEARIIACGFKVSFTPQNLRTEKRTKQLVPIIGVDGRVKEWRWV